jgi:hypothetical protein
VDSYPLADALGRYLAGRQRPAPWALAQRWTAADEEWTAYTGWQLFSQLATQGEERPDADFLDVLADIERRIGGAKNRERHAMNNAVIAIGSRNPALAAAARAAAGRIGKVVVDHGDTACQTPDAAGYIERIWARKRRAA